LGLVWWFGSKSSRWSNTGRGEGGRVEGDSGLGSSTEEDESVVDPLVEVQIES
jgi:hypothetical protein